MSTLVNETLTLAEIEQDEESDWAPSRQRSTTWWRYREREGWTRHEHREVKLEAPVRRMRGSQSEPGHHLGRGTKWIKP